MSVIIELGDGISILADEVGEQTRKNKEELEDVSHLDKEVSKYVKYSKLPDISFSGLLKKTLLGIGKGVQEAMRELSTQHSAATEAKIELALKFSAQGKLYIVNLDGDANLKVTMNIRSSEESEV